MRVGPAAGDELAMHSPRHRNVVALLRRAGLATLLLDLLSPQAGLRGANVFGTCWSPASARCGPVYRSSTWAVVPIAHDADPDPRLTASLAFPHWLCTEGMAG